MLGNFLKSGYEKIRNALQATRQALGKTLASLFERQMDEDLLEELEKVLYEADLGTKATLELTELVRTHHQKHPKSSSKDYLKLIRTSIEESFSHLDFSLNTPKTTPHVILVTGVNGSGKTTTIAKLASQYKAEGKKVLVGACDTFRAAASDQLLAWAERAGVEIVKSAQGADPAAVAFDALTKARATGADIVLLDTAGRLQNKVNLMKELEKIVLILKKFDALSPHEALLCIDSHTGQNAIDQAKVFSSYVPLTGLALTKLDSSSKGGIVVAITKELHVPVKLIGVGEKIEDLKPFDPSFFLDSIFS